MGWKKLFSVHYNRIVGDSFIGCGMDEGNLFQTYHHISIIFERVPNVHSISKLKVRTFGHNHKPDTVSNSSVQIGDKVETGGIKSQDRQDPG